MNYDLLILLHFAVNGLVGGICVCRLGKMHGVLIRVKAQYIGLLVMSAANGFSPILFSQWPTAVSILYVLWVLFILWSDGYQWREGAPKPALVSDHWAMGVAAQAWTRAREKLRELRSKFVALVRRLRHGR